MVGQAAKAGDMRAGNVAKPGMKAMNGGGGSMSRSSNKYVAAPVEKPKSKPKATSHSQMVQQWEMNGRDANGKLIKHVEKKQGWSKEEINAARDRATEERRRQAEEAKVKMTAADDAGEELEPVPDGEQAHVLARARMSALAEQLQSLTTDDEEGRGSSSSEDGARLWEIAECRRSQLEEIECLEAMFIDEFSMVSSADARATLREQCDALGDDAASADAEATPPTLAVEDAMVTTQERMAADKVLATVAVVQEGALVQAMREKAAQSLPDPCIYEAATWLAENAFEYVGQAWI